MIPLNFSNCKLVILDFCLIAFSKNSQFLFFGIPTIFRYTYYTFGIRAILTALLFLAYCFLNTIVSISLIHEIMSKLGPSVSHTLILIFTICLSQSCAARHGM